MNIWAKMITALRAGVNEAGEAIVDSQALRILDQEVRDTSEELKQSKACLAQIMAHQKLAEEKSIELQALIEEHEGYVYKALEKADESLAREVAEKILDLEDQLNQKKQASAGYIENANSVRDSIMHTQRNIKRLKQQIDTVKATENVHRAQAAVAQRSSGSHSRIRTAMDSLERIKEKQALKSAHISAVNELAEETPESSLQARLEEAGITHKSRNTDAILERIKNKKPSNNT